MTRDEVLSSRLHEHQAAALPFRAFLSHPDGTETPLTLVRGLDVRKEGDPVDTRIYHAFGPPGGGQVKVPFALGLDPMPGDMTYVHVHFEIVEMMPGVFRFTPPHQLARTSN